MRTLSSRAQRGICFFRLSDRRRLLVRRSSTDFDADKAGRLHAVQAVALHRELMLTGRPQTLKNMSQAGMLAGRIKRTFTGPMWHGSALSQLLEGVTHEQALQRPGFSVHSIWELVLHIITWVDVPLERLGGSPRKDLATEEDWPPTPTMSNVETWRATVARLEERHRALAAAVRELTDDQLDATVIGHEYTVREMLHGVVEHGTYHGGQIALLKKLAAH